MKRELKKSQEGLSRRFFLEATGLIGVVAFAQKAMAQMPILVAANPKLSTGRFLINEIDYLHYLPALGGRPKVLDRIGGFYR